MYKPSLSGKIAFAQLAQMIVFSGALALILASTARLFDYDAVISERLEPAVEDLKTAETQLEMVVEFLESGSAADLGRARAILHRDQPMGRLVKASKTLGALGRNNGLARDTLIRVRRANDILEQAHAGDIAGLVEIETAVNRLNSGSPGTLQDQINASETSAALMNLIHPARVVAGHASRMAASAAKEAERELTFRRSRLWTSILAVSAGALLLSVLFLVLAIRAMRPVGGLAIAVKRMAAGDLSPVRINSSREIEDTVDALNQMAAALSARQAAEAVEKEREVRTERLAVVGRMASAVAHEIRNPLNSISLNVDLLGDMLERPGSNPEKGREVIRTVQREVDRLNEITEDYLQFGRMPRGMIGPCDVTAVIRETCTFMAREFDASGVVVKVEARSGDVRVLSDEGQLRQALVNVLRNAVEAMPGGGSVAVTVEAAGNDRIQIDIADTGHGISAAQMSRMFEPFATTKPGGTGLGLAFVQQVITESGGTVGIESTEGRGTTIRITLKRV